MSSPSTPKTDYFLATETDNNPKPLAARDLLRFAKWILGAIVALAIWAVFIYLRYPASKEAANVFEFAKTILPPLATLILGFYFGGKK